MKSLKAGRKIYFLLHHSVSEKSKFKKKSIPTLLLQRHNLE